MSMGPRRSAVEVRTPGEPDDAGGVWISVGIAGGVVLYIGALIMLVAGFNAVLPFVIVPPVLIALIGANSLLGGPRRPRPPARPIRPTDRGIVPSAPGGPKADGRAGEASGTNGLSHPNGGVSGSSG
jgi:hypothetical protein